MRIIMTTRVGKQQRTHHQVPKFLETVLEASPVCNSQGPGLWRLAQGLGVRVFVCGWAASWPWVQGSLPSQVSEPRRVQKGVGRVNEDHVPCIHTYLHRLPLGPGSGGC